MVPKMEEIKTSIFLRFLVLHFMTYYFFVNLFYTLGDPSTVGKESYINTIFANDVNTVIDTGDTLTTATNGGGGKTCLMVGVAVELRKRGKRCCLLYPCINTRIL